jgi:hypothetical protein
MRGRPPVHPAIRFEKYVNRNGDCHEWTGCADKDGYGLFSMSSQRKSIRAPRAAWELAFGPIAEGLHVCHSCDNPGCVNVDHLWLGTNQMNTQDKMDKGRHVTQKGMEHHQAKLTDEQILDMRASDDTQEVLGERYGVKARYVGKITRREIWKHI